MRFAPLGERIRTHQGIRHAPHRAQRPLLQAGHIEVCPRAAQQLRHQTRRRVAVLHASERSEKLRVQLAREGPPRAPGPRQQNPRRDVEAAVDPAPSGSGVEPQHPPDPAGRGPRERVQQHDATDPVRVLEHPGQRKPQPEVVEHEDGPVRATARPSQPRSVVGARPWSSRHRPASETRQSPGGPPTRAAVIEGPHHIEELERRRWGAVDEHHRRSSARRQARETSQFDSIPFVLTSR